VKFHHGISKGVHVCQTHAHEYQGRCCQHIACSAQDGADQAYRLFGRYLEAAKGLHCMLVQWTALQWHVVAMVVTGQAVRLKSGLKTTTQSNLVEFIAMLH